MNNKNFKNNDHESCMEGIYGCMERIEAGINELQKTKQSNTSSAVNEEAVRVEVEIVRVSGDKKVIKTVFAVRKCSFVYNGCHYRIQDLFLHKIQTFFIV